MEETNKNNKMEDTNKRLLLLNMNLQQKTLSLFFEIMGFLKNKFETFEILTDDNFSRKKDRMFTDIHLFIKLKNGEYFHLKAYSEYNIQNIEMYENNKIYLTGYLKNSKEWKGGKDERRKE